LTPLSGALLIIINFPIKYSFFQLAFTFQFMRIAYIVNNHKLSDRIFFFSVGIYLSIDAHCLYFCRDKVYFRLNYTISYIWLPTYILYFNFPYWASLLPAHFSFLLRQWYLTWKLVGLNDDRHFRFWIIGTSNGQH
jgi:hypothetical protein